MANEGVEIPIEIPTADAVVTIEKLAAKMLLLEDAVEKLGAKGKKAGEDIATGFGQGLGQKVFDKALDIIREIPHAFEEAISASAEFGDHMVKLATKTGFSTTQLQEMALAARQSGFGLEGLARNAAVLNAKLVSSPEVFKNLGISIVEFSKKEPGEKFKEIIDKLNGIADPAAKASAAISVFGQRLGPQILPLAGALEETKRRSEELGLVWSNKMLKDAGAFTDAMEELKSAQTGFTNAIGSFISTSPEVQTAIKAVASAIGALTRTILEWHDSWETVNPAIRKAVITIGLVAIAVTALIATMAAFKIAASVMGSQVLELAAKFGVEGVAITGFGSAVKVSMLAAKGAVLDFALAAKAALAGALGVVGAVVAGLVIGNELGKWLHTNSELFRTITNDIGDFVAAIGDALGPLAKFVGLTSEADRKALEKGKVSLSDATPEQKASLAAFKASQATLALESERKKKQDEILEDLVINGEQQKKELQIASQINAVYASRGGAIASAQAALSSGLAIQQKSFEVEKANLLFQAGSDAGKIAAAEKQIAQSESLLKLQGQLARAQFDAAVAAENLRQSNELVDNAKALLDIDQQIIAAGRSNQTALEGVFQARADSVAAAKAELDVTVSKLINERLILGLTGERLKDNEQAVEQATKLYDRQVALAKATQDSALAAREYSFAVAHGTENAKLATEEAEKLADVFRALGDSKAIISPADLTLIDQAVEKAKRLGKPFAELQKNADEAFRKLNTQSIDRAIDELHTKIRRGVTIESGDLDGLFKLREQLGLSADEAERLDRAVAATRNRLAAQANDPLVAKNKATKAIDDLNNQKASNRLLAEELKHRVKIGEISKQQAEEILPGIYSQQLNITNSIQLALGFMSQLGIATDSTAGKMLDLAQNAFAAAQAGKQAAADFKSGNKVAAVGAGANVAANIFNKNKENLSGKNAALSGAAQGAAFGAAFGPAGLVIGAVAGGLLGFFSGAKFRKIAKDAGKVLGVTLSAETVKAIREDSKNLGISIQKAALLNISAAAKDSSKDVSSFAKQIGELMDGIADKSIPAAEGIAALGENFTSVAEEAEKAGRIGDRVMTDIIKKARELKIESPEIKAFVGQQLDSALEGIHKYTNAVAFLNKEWLDWLKSTGGENGFFNGSTFEEVTARVEELGKTSGVVFGAMFNAIASERGIVAAVDALGGDFEALKTTLTETLGPAGMEAVLGPFGAAFDTLNNEHLRPIFEGIDGLGQALKGLANAGFLDVSQFTAIQKSTDLLFQTAIDGGADMKTALQAVAPEIQAAISAAEQFGIPLDESTQRLKELAEANGIAFKTNPIDKLSDAIDRLVKTLGGDVPEAVDKSVRAMERLKDSAPDNVNVSGAGGGGATGGTSGRKTVNANVTVNLGINENPLAAADTAAAMRNATIQWTAEAIEDRVPRLVAALADNGPA